MAEQSGRQAGAWVGGRARGFTLVELLIVVAIIAILAAIILAVFPRVRAMSRTAACASNVKQLVQAARMYADDHDRRLVPARITGAPSPSRGYTWCVQLQPYMKNEQILTCPSDPEPRATAQSTCLPHSYGINYQLTYNSGWGAGALSMVMTHVDRHPETILFFDMKSDIEQMGSSYSSHRLSRVAARHAERATFGFLDGHAKAYLPEQTVSPVNMWTPK